MARRLQQPSQLSTGGSINKGPSPCGFGGLQRHRLHKPSNEWRARRKIQPSTGRGYRGGHPHTGRPIREAAVMQLSNPTFERHRGFIP